MLTKSPHLEVVSVVSRLLPRCVGDHIDRSSFWDECGGQHGDFVGPMRAYPPQIVARTSAICRAELISLNYASGERDVSEAQGIWDGALGWLKFKRTRRRRVHTRVCVGRRARDPDASLLE